MIVDRDMLIHAIVGCGMGVIDMTTCDALVNDGYARFTGDQHNPAWTWETKALRDLDVPVLEQLYTALTAKA